MNDRLERALSNIDFRRFGARTSVEDRAILRDRCGTLLPEWYLELLGRWPVAGALFELHNGTSRCTLEWATADLIICEAFDAVPGGFVRQHGLIPVAVCPEGSGDPFFVRFDCDDPSLIQVFHDSVAEDGVLGPNASRKVATSLSDFFERAVVIE